MSKKRGIYWMIIISKWYLHTTHKYFEEYHGTVAKKSQYLKNTVVYAYWYGPND